MITTGYLRFLISFDVNKHLSEVFGWFLMITSGYRRFFNGF